MVTIPLEAYARIERSTELRKVQRQINDLQGEIAIQQLENQIAEIVANSEDDTRATERINSMILDLQAKIPLLQESLNGLKKIAAGEVPGGDADDSQIKGYCLANGLDFENYADYRKAACALRGRQ